MQEKKEEKQKIIKTNKSDLVGCLISWNSYSSRSLARQLAIANKFCWPVNEWGKRHTSQISQSWQHRHQNESKIENHTDDFERSIWKIQFIFGSSKYPHIEEENVGGGGAAATVIFTHYPDVMRLRCRLCKFWAAATTTTIGYGYDYSLTEGDYKKWRKTWCEQIKTSPRSTMDVAIKWNVECVCVRACVHVQSLFAELLLSFCLPLRCSFFIHLFY